MELFSVSPRVRVAAVKYEIKIDKICFIQTMITHSHTHKQTSVRVRRAFYGVGSDGIKNSSFFHEEP